MCGDLGYGLGTGEERVALQTRAQESGAAPQIRFEGHVSREHIGDYFAANVFVHAAQLEAAGNVILEAQACLPWTCGRRPLGSPS